jgi:fructokinase
MAPRTIVGIGEVLWDMLPQGRQLGGAPANFAYHAAALGAEGCVVSRVGDDELGREILARLDALGVNREHVGIDPIHPTGRVDVRVDATGVPDYIIHEDAAWDYICAQSDLATLAARAAAVCYGTLALRAPVSRSTLLGFVESVPPACLRVCDVNLRQSYFRMAWVSALLVHSDLLKLNDAELPVVAEMFGIASADPRAAALELIDRFHLRLVALTRGPRGSLLVASDGRTSDHPGAPAGTVVDTVGAGDAFTAALVTGLLAGRDLDRINHDANRLAAYVCTQRGATPPIPPALAKSLSGGPTGTQ